MVSVVSVVFILVTILNIHLSTRKPLGEPAPQAANLALAVVILLVMIAQAVFNAWQGRVVQQLFCFWCLMMAPIYRFLDKPGHVLYQAYVANGCFGHSRWRKIQVRTRSPVLDHV